MELTKNRAVLDWIDQQVKLTQPDQVIWIDGGDQAAGSAAEGGLRHGRAPRA